MYTTDELTPAQLDTLSKFRKRLYDEDILHEGDTIGTDDGTLLRFLRARRWNLDASFSMFSSCQRWRNTVEGIGIDKLYEEMDPLDYPERKAVFDCWPLWFHHTDKQGRPLNIHFFGDLDLPKLYKSCTPNQHWKSILVNAESLTREMLPAASRKAGKPITSVLVLVDLKGFGLSQFWQMKSLARDSFQISQDYFPETMGALFIINAPSGFAFIYNILKPWMAPETQAKVHILGSDYKSTLLETIDASALPKYLGGECTCGEFEEELKETGVTKENERCRYSAAGPWREGRTGWGPISKKRAERLQGSLENQAVTKDIDSLNAEVSPNPLVEEKVEEPVKA
ncbi:CRAL-TRIO domain-containing protein [Flagelloscypha sp. PMI_526]|nr:CRAL-TRIO domain-containing protein [Flagelloscypha sp. PMI_526]